MKFLVAFVAVLIVAIALAGCTNIRRTYEIGIWFAGTHYEKGAHTELYSLSVGDPKKYEDELAEGSQAAGFSSRAAFRGTVYVRYPEDRNLWFSRTCRRPTTRKGIERWQYERAMGLPSSFCKDSKPSRPQRVLPKPFDKLDDTELARVEYVILYDANAIRFYLKPLTALADVKALAGKIGKAYTIRVTDHTNDK